MPFYLLFLYNLIASFFKKRFCCNGSMGCDGARNRLLQPIADSGRNAFSLMVGMNKQTVKVSGAVYIAKAYKNIVFNSDDGVMILKRLVPFIQIHLSGCPYMQLLWCNLSHLQCVLYDKTVPLFLCSRRGGILEASYFFSRYKNFSNSSGQFFNEVIVVHIPILLIDEIFIAVQI